MTVMFSVFTLRSNDPALDQICILMATLSDHCLCFRHQMKLWLICTVHVNHPEWLSAECEQWKVSRQERDDASWKLLLLTLNVVVILSHSHMAME